MRDIFITSSILIAAILVIRYLAKGRIHPILQYALWLPVVVRLIFPMPFWSSHFSILNYFPESRTKQENIEEADWMGAAAKEKALLADDSIINTATDNAATDSAASDNTATDSVATGNAATDNATAGASMTEASEMGMLSQDGNNRQDILRQEETVSAAILPVSDYQEASGGFLLFIWIAGMLLTGGYMLFYQIKWKKYLHTNRKPLQGREKYRGTLSVYTVEELPSPCLAGRCIYLAKGMASDEEQLAHILAHEYCHYRHLDSLWVIVRCVLTAVYWFHPLVWIAAYVSKQDSELACDAAVIRLLGEKERIAYGKTLLSLIARDSYDRNRIGIASTMSGKEKGIRERILLIARKPKYIVTAAGIVILLVAALIAVTFPGAGQRDAAAKEADGLMTDASQDESVGNRLPMDDLQELQEQQLSEQLQEAQREIEEKQRALQQELEEQVKREAEEAALQSLEEQRSKAVLEILSSYDARITPLGSRPDINGIADAKDPADYVQAYYENGEEALDEDIYLLEGRKGADGSDIKVYGIYTREYGCRGIKILIGDDVNDFDEPWLLSYRHGREENLRLYESAADGMPWTFACKMIAVNTSGSEIWSLYLCDRYDTGTIALFQYKAEAYMAQMKERLSFEIAQSENKIYVYDNGTVIGALEIPASDAAMKKIEEVILDGSVVSFELGKGADELKLITAVGLKIEKTDEIWYRGLQLISFPVACGSFGEREFSLGAASIETGYVNHMLQSRTSIEELITENPENILAKAFTAPEGHYDVEIQFINPCPSYTRISDTFGVRVHPVTGEEKRHDGIDLAAEKGADVIAAAEGCVYQTGYDAVNGNYVVLYHELSGEFTYYTACQEILVSEGERVTGGQRIATVGSTGRSTGAHLHFAVSRDGEYIEPVLAF